MDSIDSRKYEEEAFGMGRVSNWDNGEVEFEQVSPRLLIADFRGTKLAGRYEFRRMRWYPGNRWILTKLNRPRAVSASP